MFPDSENDVAALDKYYQHKFRDLLFAAKNGAENLELLSKDCLLIINEKNRILKQIIDFEKNCYTIIHNKN
jgi:hypothetical protein